MKGFVIYPTYRVEGEKAFVHLFGRLENGESFLTISEFKPYFFIKKSDLKKAKSIADFESEDSDFKDFEDNPVVKIIKNIPREVPELRKLFSDYDIPSYESDIRFSYRFMIDNNIKGTLNIEGDFEKHDQVDRVYLNPSISSSEDFPVKLRLLSIDIETDMKAKKIFAISLFSENYKMVLVVSREKLKNAVSFKSEKDLLRFFYDKLLELDPDVITGWNLIDFDIKIILGRLKHYKLPVSLGRTDDKCKITIYESFFRSSRANFPGRMILDGMALLKDSFVKLEDYKLETAANSLLGESKIKIDFSNKGKEIERLFREDPQKLVDYNLVDAKLVYKILIKKDFLALTIQRSLLTGMQLDRVSASIASLDSLYIRETMSRGHVCYSIGSFVKEERIKGGYVLDPKVGIYENVFVLDFKSLYPSIIRTFNIDPLSFIPKGRKTKEKNLITAPNGARFINQGGILPLLIESLWRQRDQAKKRGDNVASYAIKITMNSFFGVLANPSCRFFSLELANAITHFGQYIIKLTSKKIEERGYNIIYGDTDSVFVDPHAEDLDSAIKIGGHIQNDINSFYDNLIKKEYKRNSFLELEFDKAYKIFLLPRQRHLKAGAKKRYAGLLMKDKKEKIDVVGMELVRRDWTELAKRFQYNLLDRIFHKKSIDSYIKSFVSDLKKGKYDDDLVYKKAIRKPLSGYIKTTPPHVKAARQLDELTSNLISYVITINGPEPIQQLKSPLDYQHYIDKQLKPIADSLLIFYDKNFDSLVDGANQTSLGDF